MSGLLFVITAASGTGKTSLVKRLIANTTNLCVSISHTTRQRRPGEIDGVDYHFTSQQSFLAQVTEGQFVEHAEVFGNYYGTAHTSVNKQLQQGQDVILEIDWQGAGQVKKLFPHAILIFIIPPSRNALRQRLSARGQDSADVIEKRLAGSLTEMRQFVNFDYLVVNDDFDTALADLTAIVHARRLTLQQQQQRQADLLVQLMHQPD